MPASNPLHGCCPGRGRVGAQRQAAADPTPERPHTAADAGTGPRVNTLPCNVESFQCGALADAAHVDRRAREGDRQRHALVQQAWRRSAKALPPRAHRGQRYVQLLGDRSPSQTIDDLQRQCRADHGHHVQPSHQHQVWQQRVRSATHGASPAPNPDALDQQWCAQPAPVATPANQLPRTRRTALGWHHHLLPGRDVAGHRRRIPPYDDHGGALTTLSEPSRLLYDREGSPLDQPTAIVLRRSRRRR
jgi:hypothetical protein